MKFQKPYVFDQSARCWVRYDYKAPFLYTDGLEIEERMLGILQNAGDKTSGSDELRTYITDWPTEYHFSPYRENLLRPFDFKGMRVLEVGAGCGALTRFLSEAGADVTALEGSLRRAGIAAARCSGDDNVTVVCDDFFGFASPCRFDVVLLSGVLEYAPMIHPGSRADPVQDFLRHAKGLLGPGGVLITAIENQLGLKYFGGCSEDHTGELFTGIHGTYDERSAGPVTFGRLELENRLHSAGFPVVRFYYPFPDYKLPQMILAEEAFLEPGLPLGRMMGETAARDYSRERINLFSEAAAWETIVRNGIGQALSNSFLAFASESDTSPLMQPPQWIAQNFTSYRRKPFRTVTTFTRTGEGVKVRKELVHPNLENSGSNLVSLSMPEDALLTDGKTIKQILTKRFLNPAFGLEALLDGLAPWVGFLKEHSDDHRLPGDFIDCIPQNLIIAPDGQLAYIDSEWHYKQLLSTKQVFFRGMIMLAPSQGGSPLLEKIPVGKLIKMVGGHFGLVFSDEDIIRLAEAEAHFQSEVVFVDEKNVRHHFIDLVYNPASVRPTFDQIAREHRTLGRRIAEIESEMGSRTDQLSAELARKSEEADQLRAELARRYQEADQLRAHLATKIEEADQLKTDVAALRTSWSWRITRPLRYLWDQTSRMATNW
jgi:2-polyprenyl-3-methyl-5-hydroxy-6-metoxy-1,4-benzoquinol methylase